MTDKSDQQSQRRSHPTIPLIVGQQPVLRLLKGREKELWEEWYGCEIDSKRDCVLSRHEYAKAASLLHCLVQFYPSMTIDELLQELLHYAEHKSCSKSLVSHLMEHPLFATRRIEVLDSQIPQSELDALLHRAIRNSFSGLMSLFDFPRDFLDSQHNDERTHGARKEGL